MKGFIANALFKINRKLYYNLRYFYYRKHWINFDRPQNLSQWLLSEMLRPSFKKYAPYADKVDVRNFLINKGLQNILPQCYGVWDKADDIDFDKLPNSFVLKTNHGCGKHIVVRNKTILDKKETINKINVLLQQTFSIREPHYKFIVPKVYAEEVIDDGNGGFPIDYKFMCIKGKPKTILVCSERDETLKKTLLSSYTLEWEKQDYLKHSKNPKEIKRPEHLEEMIRIAEVLSSDFDFVRVDLYDTPNGVLFSELTFTPHSGFLTYYSEDALVKMAEGLI